MMERLQNEPTLSHGKDPEREGNSAARSWQQRHGLWLVAIAPVAAQIVATIFNIWYNHFQIRPLLTDEQLQRFLQTVVVYNLLIYGSAGLLWISIPLRLSKAFRFALQHQREAADRAFQIAQRRAINLPWSFALLAAGSWFLLIPVFLISLSFTNDAVDYRVYIHLPVSFVIGGLIGVTHGFFVVEWLAQRLLFPVFFISTRPAEVPGAWPLSLFGRGMVWIASAVVAPIICMLLLVDAPLDPADKQFYARVVATIAVSFAIATAWMLFRWISEPISLLRKSFAQIQHGELETHLELLRADEFGPMIDEFNRMTEGLREKERVREMFGRHVGREAARQILESDPGLAGKELNISVMFADLRNFTALSERLTPRETVEVLNVFLAEMVETIESCGGMVNKFLGDGLMAIFGATARSVQHCDQALAAARAMSEQMEAINQKTKQQLAIGIGIHSGAAIVGSIGPPQRRDFTTIGDTVNVASRVESLTKEVGVCILFTQATFAGLSDQQNCLPLEARPVKGKREPIEIYTVAKRE
jgi:adenylate cyclase